MVKRTAKRLIFMMAACVLMACLMVQGAPAFAKPFLIGVLNTSWGPTPGAVGLRDGLVALGYRENEHFAIGTRFVSGNLAELPTAAGELLEFGVDLIFAVGINSAKAAQQATTSLPVIFVAVDDPVKMGLVRSYARPGGNITGVSDRNSALAPKRLEVFKQMIPRLKKVLFVYDESDPGSLFRAKAYHRAGERLGIALVGRAVRTEMEAKAAFTGLNKGDVDGILSPLLVGLNIPGMVLEIAAREGIPAMFPTPFFVEVGGLASYAPGFYASGRQAARLVEKIMRGVKPAEIPVEVSNRIEFAINLKTAKALGLKIPPEVLYRADRLIR